MHQDTEKLNIHVVLGPTASGKSSAALAVAESVGAEIVSADSMQVYRGMDIGTATPTADERARVPHHGIDLREPWESFSTAEYVEAADCAIADIASRGRAVIVVGGTALYLRSLLLGIFDGPEADWDFREKVRAEAAETGTKPLHDRLRTIDPEAAERIHENDLRRIERALEIYEKTGKRPSELRREWTSPEMRYDAAVAGISRPREELYLRIDARVDAMMEAGWLDEVKRLLRLPRKLSREASQALGYSELARAAAGEADLDETVELIKTRTRQFAKRQMTWFRSFDDVAWIDGRQDAAEMESELAGALGLGD